MVGHWRGLYCVQMVKGVRVWEIWQTPSAEKVRLRHEGVKLLVEGSAENRQLVLEASSSIPQRTIGDFFGPDQRLSGQLESLGWTRTGYLRREHMAASQFKAAVAQGQRSASCELESQRLRSARQGTPSSAEWLTTTVKQSLEMDRAVEASRNAVILATVALEAFINEVAMSIPSWKEDEDKMPLKAKWTVVPALLASGQTLDRGAQPFQSFSDLVKARNRLVHAKVNERTFPGSDAYLQALTYKSRTDVRSDEGRSACLTAYEMIVAFAQITSTSPPDWCLPLPSKSNLEAWATVG